MDAANSPPKRRRIPRDVRRLSIVLFVCYGSLIASFQGIQNISVPQLVESLTPTTKVSTLASLSTVVAVVTIVALFAGGAISDRTVSRWGKRTPSLVVSAIAGVILMALLGRAHSLVALYVLMPATWFALNYYQSVLTTILPDRVPAEDLGFASAALALGVPIGIFVGVNLSVLAPSPLAANLMLGGLFVTATVCLLIVAPEAPSLNVRRGSATTKSQIQPYRPFRAFADRNFTLTFLSRFLLFLAYFTVAGYLYYILQDYVGLDHLPHKSAAAAVGIVLSITTFAWLAITPAVGLLADRIGRTGLIVAVTSIAIAAVMLIPAISGSWLAMIVFGVGIGLTFGVYFAIDLKLVTLVLPSPDTAGQDIGLLGIAASGPTVFAPALAANLIQSAGYPLLFLSGAALAAGGGLCALLIKTRK